MNVRGAVRKKLSTRLETKCERKLISEDTTDSIFQRYSLVGCGLFVGEDAVFVRFDHRPCDAKRP